MVFNKTISSLVAFFFVFSLLVVGFYAVVPGNGCYASSFNIEQSSGNQGGTNKRYIDISSQHSGAYFSESSVMVGFVEINESFGMNNVGNSGKGGSTIGGDWHSDFGANDMPGSGSSRSPFYSPGNQPIADLPPEIATAVDTNTTGIQPATDAVLGEVAVQDEEAEEENDLETGFSLARVSAFISMEWLEIY